MAYRGENQVGDETIELLRDAPNRTPQNYQTYQDLCHSALGSLQLLTITSPIQSSPGPKRFRGNIYFPIRIFKEIGEYLDNPSANSFRCASKSIKSALDIARTYDSSRNQASFRIDPIQVLNRLRGVALDTTASQVNSTIFENVESDRNSVVTQSDRRSGITSRFGFGVLIFVCLGGVYIFIRMLLKGHPTQSEPEVM
jgi:hypothetical protein